MKIELEIFKSKIARRLFILCFSIVIVPILFTALISNHEIKKLLTQGQSTLIRESTKSYGLDMFERLYNAQSHLKLVIETQALDNNLDDSDQELLSEYFLSIDKTPLELSQGTNIGNFEYPSLKVTQNGDELSISFHVTQTNGPQATLYTAELNQEYLWADTYLDAYEELCVYTKKLLLLHCSNNPPNFVAITQLNQKESRLIQWLNEDQEEMLSAHWQLYLGHQFKSSDWILVTSKPESIIFKDLYSFQNLLFLGIALALLLTTYAILFLVKKHLKPIDALLLGTQEIYKNNLQHKVLIKTNDEYEDLANSFNTMTTKLSSESDISTALTEIDEKLITRAAFSECMESIIRNIPLLTAAHSIFAYVSDSINETSYSSYRFDCKNNKLHVKDHILLDPTIAFDDIEPGTSVCFSYDQIKSRITTPYLSIDNSYTLFQLSNEQHLRVFLIVANDRKTYHPRTNEYFQHSSIVLNALQRDKLLESQANTDSLTKLHNRKYFQEQVSACLDNLATPGKESLLMFIDLDRFKNINDTLGHHIGDLLLQEASIRLLKSIPSNAICARFGGDEFTVFIPDSTNINAENIATAIITTLSDSYFIGGYHAIVSASIGISISPNDATSFDELLQCADLAMYNAKDNGREQCSFYNKQLSEQLTKRIDMERYVANILNKNQLTVYYQPKLDLHTMTISGFEALSRFSYPTKGSVSPFDVFAVAEDTGRVLELGYFVLHEALKQQVAWEQQGLWSGKMAVNVSPVQLFDTHFLAHLDLYLEKTGADPRNLELEITEGVLIDDPEGAALLLRKIHDRHISIALDDFGTGYSSLAYITHLPIDHLKIDRAFIVQIDEGEKFRGVLQSIISMAKHLGMRVTAEGIEIESHLNFLQAAECDYIQGYFYSKPLSAEGAALFLETHCL